MQHRSVGLFNLHIQFLEKSQIIYFIMYDIPMYFFPLKPNLQPVEPLHVRILT